MPVKQQTAVVKRHEPRADGTADSQRDDVPAVEPAVEPGFPRAMVKRKPDSGHGYIAAANSP